MYRGVLVMSDSTQITIAVDALGGDNAPEQVVRGAVESGVKCILIGPEEILSRHLAEYGNPDRITIRTAIDTVGMDEHPLHAVRNKKESTMMRSIALVKQGEASGVMSAGNTGAFMMGSTMAFGRLTEVTRPAAAIPIPTPSGQILLLDAGASTDCTPRDLLNFGVMGSTYCKYIWNIENPRVGLLSIGEEESKGSKQARNAYQLLKKSELNFIGNIQGSDLGESKCDVIVSDGFTGNVALKVAEGMVLLIMQIVREELEHAQGFEKIGALMLRPLLRRVKKRLDWQEYGGGALLGVAGNVVIAHGKSRYKAVASAIRLASDLARTNLQFELEKSLKAHHDISEEDIRDEVGQNGFTGS